jgi:uncharacterized protein YjbI with pentapeptide repeats
LANLKGAVLQETSLHRVDFSHAALKGSEMTVEMINVNLTGADLTGAELFGSKDISDMLAQLKRDGVIFFDTILL